MLPEHSVVGALRNVVLQLEVLEYGTVHVYTPVELLDSTDDIKGEFGGGLVRFESES
jgi:hypothetical protein